jgi:hypothetical protein
VNHPDEGSDKKQSVKIGVPHRFRVSPDIINPIGGFVGYGVSVFKVNHNITLDV